jgi:hypothetical protein
MKREKAKAGDRTPLLDHVQKLDLGAKAIA